MASRVGIRHIDPPCPASGVIQWALEATGPERAPRVQMPALLTDNGSGYIGKVMRKHVNALELRYLLTRAHHP